MEYRLLTSITHNAHYPIRIHWTCKKKKPKKPKNIKNETYILEKKALTRNQNRWQPDIAIKREK